jgi:hypothetical protein
MTASFELIKAVTNLTVLRPFPDICLKHSFSIFSETTSFDLLKIDTNMTILYMDNNFLVWHFYAALTCFQTPRNILKPFINHDLTSLQVSERKINCRSNRIFWR